MDMAAESHYPRCIQLNKTDSALIHISEAGFSISSYVFIYKGNIQKGHINSKSERKVSLDSMVRCCAHLTPVNSSGDCNCSAQLQIRKKKHED